MCSMRRRTGLYGRRVCGRGFGEKHPDRFCPAGVWIDPGVGRIACLADVMRLGKQEDRVGEVKIHLSNFPMVWKHFALFNDKVAALVEFSQDSPSKGNVPEYLSIHKKKLIVARINSHDAAHPFVNPSFTVLRIEMLRWEELEFHGPGFLRARQLIRERRGYRGHQFQTPLRLRILCRRDDLRCRSLQKRLQPVDFFFLLGCSQRTIGSCNQAVYSALFREDDVPNLGSPGSFDSLLKANGRGRADLLQQVLHTSTNDRSRLRRRALRLDRRLVVPGDQRNRQKDYTTADRCSSPIPHEHHLQIAPTFMQGLTTLQPEG